MAGKYIDHTCEKALGSAEREWRRMARLALTLRERNPDPAWAEEQESKFTGIFHRLLTDPIDEVKTEAGR